MLYDELNILWTRSCDWCRVTRMEQRRYDNGVGRKWKVQGDEINSRIEGGPSGLYVRYLWWSTKGLLCLNIVLSEY